MNKDVTILVNSCDKYEDAWEPFFRLLKIHWPECGDYKIVLSTESKVYNCDFLDVKTINPPLSLKNSSWSARLNNALEQIDTEYILFFLEDFFLLEKVQTDIFKKALEIIESDQEIGLITFKTTDLISMFSGKTDYEKCFYEVRRNIPDRTNVLIGLWRKKYYLDLLYGEENPWEYERNSNIRSKFAGYKVYTQSYDCSFPTFQYCMNPKSGYGITQGKWLCKNKELFESNGVYNVNYDNLGVFEKTTSYKEIQNKSREEIKNKLEQRKQALKQEKLVVQIREYMYDLYKRIKKNKIYKKIKYYKVCLKFFIYYKFR